LSPLSSASAEIQLSDSLIVLFARHVFTTSLNIQPEDSFVNRNNTYTYQLPFAHHREGRCPQRPICFLRDMRTNHNRAQSFISVRHVRPQPEHFTHEMIVASHFIINTLLQRGVLRGRRRKTGFNGFYALSKTAEAVRTPPPHSYTPLKQGVNERNPARMAMLVKHSG